MGTLHIDSANIEATVKDNSIVLLDFWASWCGPCLRFAPVFEKAAETHPDIVFGKVDTEEQQELAASLQIQSIPTLMMFRDGILLYREAGALPAPALEELIKQVRALDMVEVRAEMAKQQDEGQPQTS